jgi:hypothetical protein
MTRSLALASNLLLVALVSAAAAAERHCAYLNAKRYCVPAASLVTQPIGSPGIAVRTTIRDLLQEDLLYDQSAATVGIFVTIGEELRAAKMWQHWWSGSTHSTDMGNSAGHLEKTGPNALTIQHGSTGTELLIPRQDMETIPIGITECKPSTEQCSLFFDVGNLHWRVTFPYERRLQLLAIRDAAIAYLEQFRSD